MITWLHLLKDLKSSSISSLTTRVWVRSNSSCSTTPSPELLRISEPCVLVKKEWASRARNYITRGPVSIELSLSSWHREAISPTETAWVESLFTGKNSLTKISTSNTQQGGFCRWPTQARTRMDLSSSSPSSPLPG